MSEYKLKVMTNEQMAEIDKLWDEGHNEALAAYAFEAANAYKEGYEKAFNKSIATGFVIGLGLYAVNSICKVAWRKYQEKRLAEETEPEVTEE